MADETLIIRRITLHPYHSTGDDVIRLLRDLTPTEKIHLVLHFRNSDGFRFSETVELRELILQKNSNIQHLEVFDCCKFLIQFLLANNGETKHFLYGIYGINAPMQLDEATGLSNALQSNNNNIGSIESFIFSGRCDSREVFQPVWDAVLATRVRELELYFEFPKNNDINGGGNNVDFSNISTNTSLKKLEVTGPLDLTNLFHSMKDNKTVEKLVINNNRIMGCFGKEETGALQEMLCKNITLIDVTFTNGNSTHIVREQITRYTKLNRMWKRLIIVKHKEIMAAAAAAAIGTTPTNVATIYDGNVNNDKVEKKKKMEEEKKIIKKKKEMNLWLKTFEKKPVICNELIYLFLTKNAGDMYNNNGTSAIDGAEKRKRKRHNHDVDLK